MFSWDSDYRRKQAKVHVEELHGTYFWISFGHFRCDAVDLKSIESTIKTWFDNKYL